MGPDVVINDISMNIEKAFAAAGLDPNATPLANISDTIRHALNAAGIPQTLAPQATAPRKASAAAKSAAVAGIGEFTQHSFSNGMAHRDYKLFVPSSYTGTPAPLVVMLHGCKQNPDDFARGTRMNELAEAHGFLVAYPGQSVRANGSNCWNWFSRSEQSRGGEEPSLIAGIAREIGETYRIDESRVFVAGLSAGASMAVILGATYPEVFRAVAAHSGLPLGAAHDVASAFAAMQGRPSPADFTGRPIRDTERFADARPHPVPMLILHGDADTTVSPSNGDAIAEQAVHAFSIASKHSLRTKRTETDRGGRLCVVTRHVDEADETKVEQWSVQGANHAWFGGSPDGSFTEAKGPDASAEIVRFFLQQK
jgi:poly(hydroxyalkanoate) depolymerase family esterase